MCKAWGFQSCISSNNVHGKVTTHSIQCLILCSDVARLEIVGDGLDVSPRKIILFEFSALKPNILHTIEMKDDKTVYWCLYEIVNFKVSFSDF